MTLTFANNSTLEKVIIEDGVEKIGEYAFYSCKNLREVQIADSVMEIGSYTFASCNNLEEINIPNNLKEIPSAFLYVCEKIENIGNSVFRNCNKLEKINIDSENKAFKYEEGILYSINEGEVKFIANSKLNNEIFEFPYGIKIAGLGGDISNNKIKVIKIPETVTTISFDNFNSLINLENIEIAKGNNVYQNIGNGIYNKDENNKILYYYFKDEKNVILEEGIKQIDSYAFARCRNLESITFPHSLEKINNFVFYYCNKLKEIKVEENLSSMNGLSFYGISEDVNIQISSANNYYIFENGMILTKDRKELVRVITNNEEIEIPYGIEIIGNYAFHAKSNLKNVVIPNTVKKIINSFNSCSASERIEIPSSIESISSNCFYDSLNLKEIIIHKKKGEIAGSPWGSIYGDRGVIWDKY